MGFWSKVAKAGQTAKSYVPLIAMLPLPGKVKTGLVKGAAIEQEAEDLVKELKQPPTKPAA